MAEMYSIALPDRLRDSPMMSEFGGFRLYRRLFPEDVLDRLRTEALYSLKSAHEERRSKRVLTEMVSPSYVQDCETRTDLKRLIARGGAVQYILYNDPLLRQRLSGDLGLNIKPSGSHGIYAFYVRQGDYVGVHRDTCDVELITALYDSGGSHGGGALVLYPDRASDTCRAINRSKGRGQTVIKLEPGDSVVMMGGMVPHRVAPVLAGQARIVSCLSFAAGA